MPPKRKNDDDDDESIKSSSEDQEESENEENNDDENEEEEDNEDEDEEQDDEEGNKKDKKGMNKYGNKKQRGPKKGRETRSSNKNTTKLSLKKKNQNDNKNVKRSTIITMKNSEEPQSLIPIFSNTNSTTTTLKKKIPFYSSQDNTNTKYFKYSSSSRDEIIINKLNLERMLNEKTIKLNLSIDFSNDLIKVLNNGLTSYMTKTIEKLIEITRIRNVNFNPFSRNQNEKFPTFKIHTYNCDTSQMNKVNFSPYKDFSILFTKNIKANFNLIEQYHELNTKKLKFERYSIARSKIEEIAKEKGGDSKIKITNSLNPIKLGPGRRTRKRDSAIIQTIRNNFAKSQKKEDLDRQKSYTLNTLDTFLDNKPRNVPQSLGGTVSHVKFDVEMSSFKESQLEFGTKMSEISKSEVPIINNESNEVCLNIFKGSKTNEHIQFTGTSKRKIILKDLAFFLEKENEIPLKMLLLQKVMIAMTQGH